MNLILREQKNSMLLDNKLTLGTAKLGAPEYGCSDGYTLKNPLQFLLKSLNLGIESIDTSPRYGNSEELIGKALKLSNKKTFISSKIDNLMPNDAKTPEYMINSVMSSTHKLGTDIDICYLHQNEIEIISDKYVHEGIRLLKNRNLIKEVGTSIYTREELMYTLDCGIYEWVQIPVNILDTSLYNHVINHKSKIKVAARSIFLQGIILNYQWARERVKKHNELLKAINELNDLCLTYGVSIQQLSVAYLASLDQINKIIIGTISDQKLRENISSVKIKLDTHLISAIDKISSVEKPWTNPRGWQF